MDEETLPFPIIQPTTPVYPYNDIPVINPTTPAYPLYNPYESISPYPPPPTKSRAKHIILVSVMVALVIVSSLLTLVISNYKNSSNSAIANHANSIGVTPSPTQNVNYTAETIVRAFQAQGLPTDGLQYNEYLNPENQPIQAQSSASFVDPSYCGVISCGEGYVWLGVFSTVVDAQSAYNSIKSLILQDWQNRQPAGSAIFNSWHGRCVLQGESATSVYVLIVNRDCI